MVPLCSSGGEARRGGVCVWARGGGLARGEKDSERELETRRDCGKALYEKGTRFLKAYRVIGLH